MNRSAGKTGVRAAGKTRADPSRPPRESGPGARPAPASRAPAVPAVFTLFNEIGIIGQLAGTRFGKVMPEGMSIAQFSILNHFVRLGGDRSIVQLASAFQVTKPTMGELVEKLRRQGYLQVVADVNDRRGKRVSITPAGARARAHCIEALGPELQRIEKALGTKNIQALLAPLAKVRVWLDEQRN